MHVSMLFCFFMLCMDVFMYIVCIYMYVFMYMYIGMCVYICICIYVCICLCLCVGTLFYLYKSYLFECLSCRYLGCYLLVWHCYLGSVLAFSFKFQNLNTKICTKASYKSTYVL